jgi:hypothetical protein
VVRVVVLVLPPGLVAGLLATVPQTSWPGVLGSSQLTLGLLQAVITEAVTQSMANLKAVGFSCIDPKKLLGKETTSSMPLHQINRKNRSTADFDKNFYNICGLSWDLLIQCAVLDRSIYMRVAFKIAG